MLEVAHVGDIADVAHLIALMLEIAEEEVEGDGGTGVAQMGIAIDGGAADVHADAAFMKGTEEFLLAFYLCAQLLLGWEVGLVFRCKKLFVAFENGIACNVFACF